MATSPTTDATRTAISEALAKVSICVRSLSLYGRAHPIVEDMVRAAHESLCQALAFSPVVSVAVTERYLALDSFPVADSAGCLQPFLDVLRERQIGEIRFRSGVLAGEVETFAETLSMTPETLALHGGAATHLKSRGVLHITTLRDASEMEAREGSEAAEVYDGALVLAEEAMKAVSSGLPLPAADIRATVAHSLHTLIADETALLALAAIRSYDRYLSEHSVNVCIFSMMLGRALDLDMEAAMDLGVAALLHDVGKVFVPSEVVKKPGKLTEEEWIEMRKHPVAGAKALAGMPDLPVLTATVALEHHMYLDGTGYPLPGQHYPHLFSRLVTIADTYDAMTTERPYRDRWSPEEAIAWMLYETRDRYDRQLLARFASRAGLYPVGSFVRLSSGDLAVVTGGTRQHARRPVVQVVTARSRRREGQIINLAEARHKLLKIEKIAQPVEVLLPYVDALIAA